MSEIKIAAFGDAVTTGTSAKLDVFHDCFRYGTTTVNMVRETQTWRSITARIIADWIEGDVEMINAGVAGDTSSKGLARLEREVLSQSPDTVLVMFGAEDALQDVETATFRENLKNIVDGIAARNAEPVLMTPTPISERMTAGGCTLSEVRCIPDAADGLWCLLTARAPEDQGRESIAVEITLNGAGSNEAVQAIAFASLNSLAAGERMPLAVYIDAQTLNDAPFSPPYQARAELIQALPLNNTEGRYLDIILAQPVILISEDGRQAEVEVGLTQSESSTQITSRVWLLAAAYDTQDRLIGLRRWEASEPIIPGGMITASLRVFSIDGTPINHVELLFEARP